MLDKNVVRINGWKNLKRTHIDIEVPMQTIEFSNSEGEKFSISAPRLPYNIAQIGFDAGLDAVTSFNSWNWVSKERITQNVI